MDFLYMLLCYIDINTDITKKMQLSLYSKLTPSWLKLVLWSHVPSHKHTAKETQTPIILFWHEKKCTLNYILKFLTFCALYF